MAGKIYQGDIVMSFKDKIPEHGKHEIPEGIGPFDQQKYHKCSKVTITIEEGDQRKSVEAMRYLSEDGLRDLIVYEHGSERDWADGIIVKDALSLLKVPKKTEVASAPEYPHWCVEVQCPHTITHIGPEMADACRDAFGRAKCKWHEDTGGGVDQPATAEGEIVKTIIFDRFDK
jgi:hypothetical protein